MSMQEKVQEYQELQQNVRTLEQYKERVMSAIQEISTTQETMKELKNAEKDNEVLFPIGAGILAPGKLNGCEKVLVNIGGASLVKKTIEEAIDFLETRKREQEQILINLDKQLQEQYSNVQKAISVIQELQNKQD